MYQAIPNVNGLSKGLLSPGEKDQMLVRGLDAGQTPITAAAVMNPSNCQLSCQQPAGHQLQVQGNLGFQVLELERKFEFHLGSVFRGCE